MSYVHEPKIVPFTRNLIAEDSSMTRKMKYTPSGERPRIALGVEDDDFTGFYGNKPINMFGEELTPPERIERDWLVNELANAAYYARDTPRPSSRDEVAQAQRDEDERHLMSTRCFYLGGHVQLMDMINPDLIGRIQLPPKREKPTCKLEQENFRLLHVPDDEFDERAGTISFWLRTRPYETLKESENEEISYIIGGLEDPSDPGCDCPFCTVGEYVPESGPEREHWRHTTVEEALQATREMLGFSAALDTELEIFSREVRWLHMHDEDDAVTENH